LARPLNFFSVLASHLFPGTLIDGRAVSTTLEIVYVREEITLLDQINYTIHLANRIDKVRLHLFTLSGTSSHE
jgi:hypothetical protein